MAKISNEQALKAYNVVLAERAAFRIKESDIVKLKQQVPQTIIKEVIKPVTVIREVPVPIYKEITVLHEVLKDIPEIRTVIKKVPDIKAISLLNSKISKLEKALADAKAKLKVKPKTIVKEVIKEIVKEVPVEIIKEVEVVKSLDMATLQKMVSKMGTVQVSKKVIGESRTKGEGTIVSRKEIKPGSSKTVVTGKAIKVTQSSTTTSSAKGKGDDLTKIEGIGPAIAKLLNNDKIFTFKDLSKSKISDLQAILTKAGPKFQMHTPGSWPKQASLAADGKWEDLKKLQDVLDGGK